MQRDKNLSRQMGSRIRKVRENKGITQVDLAVVCQVTREQIQRIESGNKRPSFEVLGAICQELNITADYVIQDGQRVNQEYLLTEYAKYFMALDTRDQQIAIQQLKALADARAIREGDALRDKEWEDKD